MLDTIGDLVGKVEERARKPWITQEMISKMDERREWKNVNTEKGRRNYRRLRNELKRATEKARKEYLENICNVYLCLKFVSILISIHTRYLYMRLE
jgi:type I site-specific restriction endonuclease